LQLHQGVAFVYGAKCMNIVANILLEEQNEPPALLVGWGSAVPFCETPSHAGPHKQKNAHSRPAS